MRLRRSPQRVSASCTRFSPKTLSPAIRAASIRSSGCCFDTPMRVIEAGERSLSTAACDIVSRTLFKLLAISLAMFMRWSLSCRNFAANCFLLDQIREMHFWVRIALILQLTTQKQQGRLESRPCLYRAFKIKLRSSEQDQQLWLYL